MARLSKSLILRWRQSFQIELPEHLELCVSDPENLAKKISNAGAIFLGHWTPEAVGDYVTGPNHVLPTARSARFSSGLSVMDFLKRTTLAKVSRDALLKLGLRSNIGKLRRFGVPWTFDK